MKPAETRKGAKWLVLAFVSAVLGAAFLGRLAFWLAVGAVILILWLLMTTRRVLAVVNRWILRRSPGISDTFKRRNRTEGWGRSTNGLTWRPVTEPSKIWIENERGVIGFSGNDDLSQWVKLDDYSIGNCEALVQFAISGQPTGANRPTAGVFVSLGDNQQQYLARYNGAEESIDFMVGPVGLKANRKPRFETISSRPYTVVPGFSYVLRFGVADSSFFVRIWQARESEPDTWNLRGTIPWVHLKGSGGLGLYGYGVRDGPTVQFQGYKVAPNFVPPGADVLHGSDR